jgi:hypothetical protein
MCSGDFNEEAVLLLCEESKRHERLDAEAVHHIYTSKLYVIIIFAVFVIYVVFSHIILAEIYSLLSVPKSFDKAEPWADKKSPFHYISDIKFANNAELSSCCKFILSKSAKIMPCILEVYSPIFGRYLFKQ